ncbi:Jag N-terminal domain-containing protein [uncultured Campylobacter sp.]|uniref:Jag N-terminal domain-containing protein n=1 Tax=uncultured Campylobacter sp. TaxID=218934 RepID=UPI00261AF165|nr:Jag N-terminal domain-containing protein [uncultured Campylobacter sp.]
MRIEAENLQEAFQKAAQELNCSVTELDIKILQNPSAGFLGFFKKTAIIEAVKEGAHKEAKKAPQAASENGHKENGGEKKKEFKKKENSGEEQNHRSEKKKNHKNRHDHHKNHAAKQSESSAVNESKVEEAQPQKEPQVKEKESHKKEQPKKESGKSILDHSIIDTFNKNDFYEGDEKTTAGENLGLQASVGDANLTQAVPNLAKKEKQDSRADRAQAQKQKDQKPKADIDKALPEIKQGVEKLFGGNFFTINKIDVRKFDDETVIVELDGEDAALLIGKEGYRYKAISYLLYNWISSKYGLAVRLEIAQFLQNQEAAIDQYLKGIIERVEETGKAKTKSLDGVLVKIALEKLREKFPDKYVSVKSNSDGQFVVVNDFIKK